MKSSSLSRFFSYLVFEGHGTRIGLELSACVLLYTVAATSVPWMLIGIEPKWGALVSWFGACSFVLVLDQYFLCRSVYLLRKAYLYGLAGACDKAVEELERIAPHSRAKIPLPHSLYHLYRAEFFSAASDFSKARSELEVARKNGAEALRISVMESRILRKEGKFSEAASLLAVHESSHPAVIRFEQGLLFFEQQEEIWQAKKAFKETMDLRDEIHFSGETTYHLARAYFNVCRLRTGEAEEGLEELEGIIDRFCSSARFVDSLRPVASQLLLERSMYYATHKEPSFAVLDLKNALSLCHHPWNEVRGDEIKEELAWRHQLLLA